MLLVFDSAIAMGHLVGVAIVLAVVLVLYVAWRIRMRMNSPGGGKLSGKPPTFLLGLQKSFFQCLFTICFGGDVAELTKSNLQTALCHLADFVRHSLFTVKFAHLCGLFLFSFSHCVRTCAFCRCSTTVKA